ncbi:hypothetical protein OG535_05645 [Kitasatospora sp. NBC_00085]|uniref:hypothetical protein n=1 Tax=unclassified Kitasatospora TaxID=2633591 RepID=UPI003254FDDF
MSTPHATPPRACPAVAVTVPTGEQAGLGVAVTREQFWHRTGDSYSLAPGETRAVSYTVTGTGPGAIT